MKIFEQKLIRQFYESNLDKFTIGKKYGISEWNDIIRNYFDGKYMPGKHKINRMLQLWLWHEHKINFVPFVWAQVNGNYANYKIFTAKLDRPFDDVFPKKQKDVAEPGTKRKYVKRILTEEQQQEREFRRFERAQEKAMNYTPKQ